MKVILINGSPRKEGNTSIALKEVAHQSTNGEKAPGRPVEEVWEAMHFIR